MPEALGWVLALVIVGGPILLWGVWNESTTRADLAANTRKSSGVDQVICTACGTRNAEKAKVGTRVASGVVGGLVFSRKARAQFHCRTCNRYW